MQIRDLFEGEARPFGIWLGRLYDEMYHKEAGIFFYDYHDDEHNQALRYRLMVDSEFLAFVHQVMPQINAQGWHLTAETKASRKQWQLVFEPTLTSRVPRTAIFWHLTRQDAVDSILQKGLVPAQSRHGFTYPQPRVYFLKSERDANTMRSSFANRDKKPVNYAVLKVDLRKAKTVKLHIDPELAKVAVYTTDPVPPEYISQTAS